MDYFDTIGYVFQPSAQEILTIFLPRRLANLPIGSPPDLYAKLVNEFDLYDPNKEPSEIFGEHYNDINGDKREDKCFYFFTRVKPVSTKAGYGLGKRTRRRAGRGTWRAEKPEEIRAMFVDGNGHYVEGVIGTKGLFKYILGSKEEAENGNDVDDVVVSWIMHEYRMNLGGDNPLSGNVRPENGNIVFCCVRKCTKYVDNNNNKVVVSCGSKRPISLVDGGYHQDCCNVAVENKMLVSMDYRGYNGGGNNDDDYSREWNNNNNNNNVGDQENVSVVNNGEYMIEGGVTMGDRGMVEVGQQVANMEQSYEEMRATIISSEPKQVSLEGEDEDEDQLLKNLDKNKYENNDCSQLLDCIEQVCTRSRLLFQ